MRLATSRSLLAEASAARAFQVIPGPKYGSAAGRDPSFSYGVILFSWR